MSVSYFATFVESENYFLYKRPDFRQWGSPLTGEYPKYKSQTDKNPISTDICVSAWEQDWFHAYRRVNSGPEVDFWAISDPQNYPKLVEWLSHPSIKGFNQDSLYVSLGPNGSFFARCNLGYRWHGIPDGAETILQSFLGGNKWRVKPNQFLFGQSDCYIIIDDLGKVYYDEKKRDFYYPLLFDELDRIAGQEGTVEFLSFRPSNSPACDYFLVYNINDTRCVLPYAESWKVQERLIALKRKISG
ncbi:hypothetical protein TWF730_002691 [Orbilia blumenaviensis]|uniref:Uncharacterized protein n=1 Tax=Orbilia blumenaviensis TaxID=1796055 RepID=A0AAV9UBC8_9PEZI